MRIIHSLKSSKNSKWEQGRLKEKDLLSEEKRPF
jgi:hypothetical protein